MTKEKAPQRKTKAKLPHRKANPDGSVTLLLLEPIIYGEEEKLEQLDFIKPKAKHIKKMNLDDKSIEGILLIAGKLCGQPPSVLDELGMHDLMEIGEVIDSFLPDTAKGGNQP